ncbi:MAG: ECF transporter S component [Clostridia bacterium]|nr:ECF transporter S component [Clostridia bacterium]
MKSNSIKKLVIYAMFTAIVLLLGLTSLGYIYLPMAAIVTVHIPVILGGFILGIKGGAYLGFIFGLTSLIQCFMAPDAIAAIVLGTDSGFGVYNVLLIICVLFLPRVLTGLFSSMVYRGLSKLDKSRLFAMPVAAVTGALTNTVFLLGALALLAFDQACVAFGAENAEGLFAVIIGLVTSNGLIEAGVAAVICTAVGKALFEYTKRHPLGIEGGM